MKTLLPAMITLLALAFGQTAHAQAPAGDAAAGEKKNAMCIGCHGIVGYQSSFPEVYKVPKIAGQSAPYIVAALQAYKKGERKHPSMRAVSQSLTDQDMADLAAYYATEGGQSAAAPATPPAPGPDIAALLQKGACASCHGANFNKPIDPSYPKLAGQHADYLHAALRAYKTDKNPNVGRANAIMAAQAKPYSAAELKAMSDYIAGLPGELKTNPQPKFK